MHPSLKILTRLQLELSLQGFFARARALARSLVSALVSSRCQRVPSALWLFEELDEKSRFSFSLPVEGKTPLSSEAVCLQCFTWLIVATREFAIGIKLLPIIVASHRYDGT